MTGSTAARPKPDLVEKLAALARETGSTRDELAAAAREYAEYERWKEAMIQEALDDEAAGAPTYDAEEVFAEWTLSWRSAFAPPENEGPRAPGRARRPPEHRYACATEQPKRRFANGTNHAPQLRARRALRSLHQGPGRGRPPLHRGGPRA